MTEPTEPIPTDVLREIAADMYRILNPIWMAPRLRAAADELDRLRTATAWQPIEDAPIGQPGIVSNGRWTGEASNAGIGEIWRWADGTICDPVPTSWMYMPKPSDATLHGWKPPIVYDVTTDTHRIATQADIDRMKRTIRVLGDCYSVTRKAAEACQAHLSQRDEA